MGRRSSGFTLIEMLVSIAVIGILAALLLPAVQAAREAARYASCSSNLKQIALAMSQYHDVHGTLPPGKKGCCWGTWLIFILPQVEQQALFNAYNFAGNNTPGLPPGHDLDLRYFGSANRTVTSTSLEVYLCPSDLTNAPISTEIGGVPLACTSQNYAGNFGNTLQIQEDLPGNPFGGAAFGDVGSPIADHSRATSPTVAFRDFTDGTSNTMLAAEVVVGQGADLRGFSWWGDAAGFETYLGPNSPLPDVMAEAAYCANQAPNPPCVPSSFALSDVYAARSRHPGKVHVGLADGSVRSIQNSIQLVVWRALSTTRGSEVIGADSF